MARDSQIITDSPGSISLDFVVTRKLAIFLAVGTFPDVMVAAVTYQSFAVLA